LATSRLTRRMAGVLSVRLPELKLEAVADPRRRRDRRWKPEQVLRAVVVGIMAGCKSLLQVEALTAEMSPAMRRLLGIGRRLADTTLRDSLCRLDMQSLRQCLQRLVKAAWRRKALAPVGLPIGVVAMDGKATALPSWEGPYAQRAINEDIKLAYGVVRTLTCTLVSSAARVCIDAMPIPKRQNEVSFFKTGFASLVESYSELFELVTYDAGGASQGNAHAVVAAGKHYLFRLRDDRRLMLQLAQSVLASKPVSAQTEDVLSNQRSIVRRLYIAPVNRTDLTRNDSRICWRSSRVLLRVESMRFESGQCTEHENRYYVTSMPLERLTAEQWLHVVRLHWGVENNNHHTFDAVFEEDDRPFIEYAPHGMLVVLLLRRIAYNLLALFRSVTQRSDERRGTPWRDLLRWVYNAVISASDVHLTGLRGATASL
jgi:hypothetical protein